MKVVHILHSLKFSGAEIMYVDAAPTFQAKGCKLTVIATAVELGEFASFFEKAGYTVLHKPMPPLKNYIGRIKYYANFIKLLKRENFEVVHIHSSLAMWGMAFCAWVLNIRSVYTFHSVFPTRIFTYPYHLLLRWSAKNIFKCRFQTISDSVHDHELKLYYNKTIKIYNWYGHSRNFPAAEGEKSSSRMELGIDREAFVLISVGSCNPNKRHFEILKAFQIVLKKIPNCIYLHLGQGDCEQEEIELAIELGVEKQVRFCGNQIDVRQYMIAADVYLMTSCFEGISITTIEAMACSVPAILYDVPGLRDFNKDENISILIQEDYNILADQILKIYYNPAEANKMADKAKLSVDQLYNIKHNAEKIYNLYV